MEIQFNIVRLWSLCAQTPVLLNVEALFVSSLFSEDISSYLEVRQIVSSWSCKNIQ